MKRMLLASFGMWGFVMAATAAADDSARIRELEQKLERSMQLIEALSAKVARLEQGATAQAPAPSAEQQARIDVIEHQLDQLGAGLSRRSVEEGLQLRGFADVRLGYSGENNQVAKGKKGFSVGNLDLYFTPQFGDRVRTLVELVFEVNEDGHTEADLERAQIGYAFSDAAVAWLGRFHTPYGYWNTAYHHGAQLQTSVLRPRFLEFEEHTGVLPAHTVGSWLTGSVPVAGNRLGYDLYIGNAPRIADLDAAGRGKLTPMAGGSTGHRYTAGFNAWLEPGVVDGLRLGLHGLRSTVEDEVDNRTRLGMLGGYGVYSAKHWEVLGEYFHFRDRNLSGGSGTQGSWAAYVQAAYSWGSLTPFLRLENARLALSDPYFSAMRFGRSYRRTALGLRYDLDPRAALKVELANTGQEDVGAANDHYNEAHLQYSIRF